MSNTPDEGKKSLKARAAGLRDRIRKPRAGSMEARADALAQGSEPSAVIQPEVREGIDALFGGEEVVVAEQQRQEATVATQQEESQRIEEGQGINAMRELVDPQKGELYFTACGREPERNPYYEHLYRVNLDGSDLVLLTPEASHHDIVPSDFEPDDSSLSPKIVATPGQRWQGAHRAAPSNPVHAPGYWRSCLKRYHPETPAFPSAPHTARTRTTRCRCACRAVSRGPVPGSCRRRCRG